MDGTSGFWLGLALSAPIGTAINLITAAVQKWLSTTSSERRLQQRRCEANYRRLVTYLGTHRGVLIEKMITALLQIVVIVALGGIFVTVFALVVKLLNSTLHADQHDLDRLRELRQRPNGYHTRHRFLDNQNLTREEDNDSHDNGPPI